MSDDVLPLRALNRATLARQLLLGRAALEPVAAIERVAGLQAQLARPPYIGLWSRVEGFTRDALTRAAVQGDIVRATLMRGTIHLVSKKDFLAWRAAIQPCLTRAAQSVVKRRGALDVDAIVEEGRAFFTEEPRTFDELRKHLLARHPGADERNMAYTIRMHLPLVQVPDADAPWGWSGAADFADAATFLRKPIPTAAKTGELALRFFAAFGPATAADLQTWSGLQGGKEIVAQLRKKLRVFRDERGRELFDLPDAPRPDPDVDAPVRFLPDYDNLLLAHADRTRVIADEHRARLTPVTNLRIMPAFLVDGFVAGTWDVAVKKRDARMLFEPFVPLSKKVKTELAREGERLLRFIEPEAATYTLEL